MGPRGGQSAPPRALRARALDRARRLHIGRSVPRATHRTCCTAAPCHRRRRRRRRAAGGPASAPRRRRRRRHRSRHRGRRGPARRRGRRRGAPAWAGGVGAREVAGPDPARLAGPPPPLRCRQAAALELRPLARPGPPTGARCSRAHTPGRAHRRRRRCCRGSSALRRLRGQRVRVRRSTGSGGRAAGGLTGRCRGREPAMVAGPAGRRGGVAALLLRCALVLRWLHKAAPGPRGGKRSHDPSEGA
jgi:hypothetical protein